MKWFLDLATRVKLMIGYGLMIIFLVITIVTAYANITAIQRAQKSLYQEEFTNATDLLALRSNENGARAALLTMMVVTKRSDQEVWHQDIKEYEVMFALTPGYQAISGSQSACRVFYLPVRLLLFS